MEYKPKQYFDKYWSELTRCCTRKKNYAKKNCISKALGKKSSENWEPYDTEIQHTNFIHEQSNNNKKAHEHI